MKIQLVFACVITATSLTAKSLLIIDTENSDLYGYHRLKTMCAEAGFDTETKHFYDINKDLTHYDAVLFCISEFLINNQQSPIVQPIIKNITEFARQPDKLLILAFPGLSVAESLVASFAQFMKGIGLTHVAESADAKNYFALNIVKNINYHTMLEGTNKNFENPPVQEANNLVRANKGSVEAALLPIDAAFNDLKEHSFPIGMYIKNQEHQNHIFICRCPILAFDEVSENFWIDPVDPTLRSRLLEMEEQALRELCLLSAGRTLDDPKSSSIRPHPSIHFATQNTQDERAAKLVEKSRVPNVHPKISAAWMAPDAFDPSPTSKQTDEVLQKQIQHIADAHLNLLWFSFSPELYLSVHARLPETKELQLNRIRTITRALKEKFAELKRPVPAIYIGIELTGNYHTAKIHEPMIDLFGNVYDKVPAPFDIEGFWKPEFLDVFDQFADIWDNDVGSGLPISGIFFDFEMYHSQPKQPGSYPGLADFSQTSMNLFEKTKLAPSEFAQQLFKEGKLNDYFGVLKKEAYALGRMFRNHIKKRLPHAKLAAYFPNVSTDWFYMGMFGGLSTPKEPLILATFNKSIKGSEAWLRANNIYVKHLAAILLSKFQNLPSFNLIDELNATNDGVWFNRFSWLAHPYDDKAWWATESTPFDHDVVAKEIGKHFFLGRSGPGA